MALAAPEFIIIQKYPLINNCYYVPVDIMISIEWGIVNASSGYIVEYQCSDKDSKVGGEWVQLVEVQNSGMYFYYHRWDASLLAGTWGRYRICAKTSGQRSDWTYSNWIRISGSAKIRVSGSYKEGTPFIKLNGTWTRAKYVFVKQNGVWNQSV